MLAHLLDEFVDDGAYRFASGFRSAPDLFVVGFTVKEKEENGAFGSAVVQPFSNTLIVSTPSNGVPAASPVITKATSTLFPVSSP